MPVRKVAALLAIATAVATAVVGVIARPRQARAASLPRVSFVAAPGASILVHGTYPRVHSPCKHPVQPLLHARFQGTIEVGRDTDGSLFVIGVMPFEDYLKGIAEVPRTWPMQALKAQVVAARTYALAHMRYPDPTGDRLGYQLCATDACQVFLGLGISQGPYGTRWQQAVDRTAGQVLLYAGRPADTLYFSTSKGETLGNDQVFGTAPLPYLRPVTEKDDGASPLSHWKLAIPFADVGRFLLAAGEFSSSSVSSVVQSGQDMVVKGGGHTATLSLASFRSDLNYWSHCLDPDHYPPVDEEGVGLPQTVPSVWFDASTSGHSVVLTGRGWGHGVGMVQWGAEGKAARGLSYRDILAAYYGGLRPQHYAEPGEIRVGIAVGLNSVTIQGSGQVMVAGRTVGPGPWVVTGGATLDIHHSDSAPTFISAGRLVQAPTRLRAGRTMTATVSVPQLSVVQLVLPGPAGDIPVTDPITVQAGTSKVSGAVPDVISGTYELTAVVTNGIDIVRTSARTVNVTGLPPPSPSPAPSPIPTPRPTPTVVALPASRAAWVWPAVIAAVAAMLVGSAILVAASRRRRRRQPRAS